MARALAGDGRIRALALRTTGVVAEAQRRHGTWPTATAALGRALTGAAALAVATLKDRGTLTLRLAGGGPIGWIIAEARPDGAVRGYAAHPHVDLPPTPAGKLDVGRAVGSNGSLSVTVDFGLQTVRTSSIPLVSGEIAEDIGAYLLQSEQVPSLVALGVLVAPDGGVRAAGGLLLQLLPGADGDWVPILEANAAGLAPLSQRLGAGETPEDLLGAALRGFAVHWLGRRPLRFACTCSRERLRSLLLMLGRDELKDMLTTDGGAEARCHWCGEVYHFDAGELEELVRRAERAERDDGGDD